MMKKFLFFNLILIICGSIEAMGPHAEWQPYLGEKELKSLERNSTSTNDLEAEFKNCCLKDADKLSLLISKNVNHIKENINQFVDIALECQSRFALTTMKSRNCFEMCDEEAILGFLRKTTALELFTCFTFFLNYIIEKNQDFAKKRLNSLTLSLVEHGNAHGLALLKQHECFRICSNDIIFGFLASANNHKESACFNILFLKLIEKQDQKFIEDKLNWLLVSAIRLGSSFALDLLKENHYLDDCSTDIILKCYDKAKELNQIKCIEFFENFDCIKKDDSQNISSNECKAPETSKKDSRRSRKISFKGASQLFKISGVKPSAYRDSLMFPKEKSNEDSELASIHLITSIIDHPYNLDAIKANLALGGNPNTCYEDEKTILMYAAACGYSEIVAELLRYGAKPNLVDGYGNTALIYAAQAINADCIRHLVDAKADPRITNTAGKNALLILAEITDETIYRKIYNICFNHALTCTNLSLYSEQVDPKEKEHEPKSPRNNTQNQFYAYIYDEMRDIKKDDPFPLMTLSKNLEKNMSKAPEVKERNNKLQGSLKTLIQHEVNNIFNSCAKILETNNEIFNSENEEAIIDLVIANDNIGALKALMHYITDKTREKVLIWAAKHNQKFITKFILENKYHE